MDIYERIYKRLDSLTGGIKLFLASDSGYSKLNSVGYMDLTIERIGHNEISLAHYYEQNSDLVTDPEMTVRIHSNDMAEALTFSMSGIGLYQEVYFEKDRKIFVRTNLKKQLNVFLEQWLLNLKNQRFYAWACE